MDLAQRLGYPAGTRLLVLHSDDMGCSHASNSATFELMEAGRLTSGSVIVPSPFLDEVADYQRGHPEADIGVHLALTSEHPKRRWTGILGREACPSLHDADGYLPMTVAELLERADPEEAARELRAQVEVALARGIDVTHLDSHMGAVFHGRFRHTWTALAVEFQLPTFIDATMRGLDGIGAMETAGVPVIDKLIHDTYGPDKASKAELFPRLIDGLAPGFTHLLIHPAHDTPELQQFIHEPQTRIADYELFAEGALHEQIEGMGVVLIGHRPLRDAIRAGRFRG
ncbi:MAG: polysaccharide deacetylase family protein [Tepidiformaceae bacterium]